jgi:uncharacterized LabA/DUF88 family protein
MSVKHTEQRVGVFVDVANMYYSAKNLYGGAKVDFGKVLKDSVSGRRLVRAFAYVIKADIEPEQAFYEALTKQGYEVRAKDLQVFFGGAKKGDWDVGICMDAIRMAPKLDVVVLVSGDGDFVDLIDYLRGQGLRTEVIGFKRTTSSRLIDEADEFLDLESAPDKFLIRGRKS